MDRMIEKTHESDGLRVYIVSNRSVDCPFGVLIDCMGNKKLYPCQTALKAIEITDQVNALVK